MAMATTAAAPAPDLRQADSDVRERDGLERRINLPHRPLEVDPMFAAMRGSNLGERLL